MLDRPQLLAVLAGAAASAVAIGSMEAFSIESAFPLFAIPFGTSIVTVLGSPKAEPAQHRAPVGGHLVSTVVGLLVVKLCGPAPWAAAVAVGLAMVAMHLTYTFHLPAGIDPLVVVVNNMSWTFMIVPVGLACCSQRLLLLGTISSRDAPMRAMPGPIRWW
ncbi:HPP family protein [Bradyrhizobium sp. USDA 10063]